MPVLTHVRLVAPLVLLLFVLTTASASAAPTPVLYGATGGQGRVDGNNTGGSGELYRVDPATGDTTLVGATGFGITGLAIDPTTGILYGATTSNSADDPNSLVTIDKATGDGTVVGEFDPDSGASVADITFRPGGELVGWSENSDDFVTIDKTTGAATVVGNPDDLSTFGDGLSVDENGTIFAMLLGNEASAGDLRTIDPATGDTTLVAELNGGANDSASIPAASFACDRRTLFALDGLTGSNPPDFLVTVNTTTGEITEIGETGVRLGGLEWDCPTEIGVSATAADVSENAGSITVTVNRVGGRKGATSVQFSTANGSAVAGEDYTPVAGTLNFADNETQKTVSIPMINDPNDEPDETFTFNLSNPAANATATPATQTITIRDDDPTPENPAPDTTITAGPSGPTDDPTPRFRFTSNIDGASFECRVDDGAFSSCSSPFTTRRLSDGRHRFQVRATANGVTDPTPASRTFTVDTRGPRVGISGAPVRLEGSVISRRLTCPASELSRCTGTLTLRAGGRVLGRARFTIEDGRSRVVRVRLSADARRLLRANGRTRVVATTTARDALGNRGTSRRTFVVTAAVRRAAPRFTG